MTDTERSLRLAGAPNARDLGGLPARGGRRVRSGRLIRASALGRLSDDDVSVLDRRGLVEVLDLRHATETALGPPDRLPAGVPVVELPIFDPQHPVFMYVTAILSGVAAADYRSIDASGSPAAMVDIYRWFVTAAEPRIQFAAAIRRIAAAAGQPVLFHCSAGKDRTGWLAALVLEVLGVDRNEIARDYLLTNVHAHAVTEFLVAATAARGADPEVVRPILTVAPQYLQAAYREVDQEFGSLAGYLRDGLGLDDAVLETLRAHLLR